MAPMLSTLLLALSLTSFGLAAEVILDVSYNDQSVRGVNIGGWLVLEVGQNSPPLISFLTFPPVISHGLHPLYLRRLVMSASSTSTHSDNTKTVTSLPKL